jgi:hypothetical protein
MTFQAKINVITFSSILTYGIETKNKDVTGKQKQYVRRVLKLPRNHFGIVPKLRVPLELYGVDVFPALGFELSGLLRNMSQFPLVKTWGIARGGLSHV